MPRIFWGYSFPLLCLSFFLAVSLSAQTSAGGIVSVDGEARLVRFSKAHIKEPVGIEHAHDGSGRLFIVEQGGKIRILLPDGKVLRKPFLNVSRLIPSAATRVTEYETGLLGLSFHPDYATNGRFFIYYTNKKHTIMIREFAVSPGNPDVARRRAVKTLFRIPHPHFFNHFGGQMAFGPDGYLYIGVADGGGIGDPLKTSQNLKGLQGKILRVDVNNTDGRRYGIPADNPFVGTKSGARNEIWAYGFRNPWRFSFEPDSGRLFVGDVGQHRIEEIDIVEPGGNYGWPIMEGNSCYASWARPIPKCDQRGYKRPIHQYYHPLPIRFTANAVIGGFFYQGQAIAGLQGRYLFSDFTRGKIWTLRERVATEKWREQTYMTNIPFVMTTFGQDEENEIYVTNFSKGRIFKLVATEAEGNV